jgi:hypothetical protein
LADAGHQTIAHDDFLHVAWLQSGTFNGGANRCSAKFRCSHVLKHALKTAHGGTGGADDYDGVLHYCS